MFPKVLKTLCQSLREFGAGMYVPGKLCTYWSSTCPPICLLLNLARTYRQESSVLSSATLPYDTSWLAAVELQYGGAVVLSTRLGKATRYSTYVNKHRHWNGPWPRTYVLARPSCYCQLRTNSSGSASPSVLCLPLCFVVTSSFLASWCPHMLRPWHVACLPPALQIRRQ
jgi:hypothetical protein